MAKQTKAFRVYVRSVAEARWWSYTGHAKSRGHAVAKIVRLVGWEPNQGVLYMVRVRELGDNESWV